MPLPGLARSSPSASHSRAGFWLYAAVLFTVFGIALSNGLLLLSLLLLPWTVPSFRPRLRPAVSLLAMAGLYLLFLGLSIAFSYHPALSWRAHSEVFNLAPLPLALLLVRGERDVRRILDGLVIVGGVVALYALLQLPAGFGEWHRLVDLDQRIRGPFSHYMTLAGFLLVCDLLLIASMLFGDGWKQLWRWGLLTLLTFTLLVNQSRNAWVALAVVGTLLLLVRRRKLLLAYVPLAVLLLLWAPAPLLDRVASVADPEDPSNYDRLCMLDAGGRMIVQRPVTGIGPEMVEELYPLYRPATAPRYQRPHLHNTFLHLAAERGLPALVAYLAWLAVALAAAWRGLRRIGVDGPQADLYAGVLAVLVAFNVAGLFENNWGDTEVQRTILFLMAVPYCLQPRLQPSVQPGPPAAQS